MLFVLELKILGKRGVPMKNGVYMNSPASKISVEQMTWIMPLILGGIFFSLSPSAFGDLKDHHHGQARLNISMEAQELRVQIFYSGEDLFGFESIAKSSSKKGL